MTADQVRAAHRAQPFQPFEINLADGRSFRVTHPEAMLQTPGGRTICVAVGDEVVEWIDLLLVTSLTKGNGHTRPRTKRKR